MPIRPSRPLASAAWALAALSWVATVAAQQPERTQQVEQQSPQPVFSVGQPPQWKPCGAVQGVATRDESAGTAIVAGVARPLLNPVSGLLSLAGEAYGSPAGQFAGGGARLIARVPMFGLGVGADWNLGRGGLGRMDALFTFQTAVRRGGLLGHGTMLRIGCPRGDAPSAPGSRSHSCSPSRDAPVPTGPTRECPGGAAPTPTARSRR